jgi:hypothetical protein
MSNFSVGCLNGRLTADKTALNGGFLYIYAGTMPAAAGDAISSGTLLAKITESGDGSTGLTFGTPAGGVLAKTPAEDWSSLVTTSGTAAFFRFCDSSDTPAGASSTKVRYQGTCGLAGADLNLETVTLVANGTNKVGAGGFQITLT